jgi:hypothetical protein
MVGEYSLNMLYVAVKCGLRSHIKPKTNLSSGYNKKMSLQNTHNNRL